MAESGTNDKLEKTPAIRKTEGGLIPSYKELLQIHKDKKNPIEKVDQGDK